MTVFLDVKKLFFGFGHHQLFADLSFNISAGEILHIVGPNGVGKSTLLQIVVGLLAPKSGSVTFADGLDVEYLSADANAHFLRLNAAENLKFWLEQRGSDYREPEIRDVLMKWEIDLGSEWKRRKVGQYSTGMARKLALARVQMSEAKLWILDEPILGLDKNAKKTFSAVIEQKVKVLGGAVIITGHDMDALPQANTRILNLEKAEKHRA